MSETAQMTTRPLDPLTVAQEKGTALLTKLAYGAGDVSAAIVTQVTGFFLTAFLLEVALLGPGLVALIVLISNMFDAITDPLVGNLSDRTRTRWGRRRPWLLFGAVPFGLAFMAQWWVPPVGQTGLFAYYLVVAILLKLAFTIINVPYTALTPEIAQDYDERTSLTSYRFAFSIASGLLAVISYPAIVGALGETQTSYLISGGVLALFVIASPLVTFAGTRENEMFSVTNDVHKEEEGSPGFVEGLRIAFQNRPFMFVVGIYLCCWLVVQFVQANLLLYLRYWIGNDDLFTPFVLVLQVTSFAFLGVWAYVSRHLGKRTAYFIGLALFIPLAVSIYFLPQNASNTALYITAFIAGICVSMALLMPWSMLPDVVDYDELQTGERREGVYYGLFVFIQKVGLSLALAGSSFLLDLGGYVNPEETGAFVEQPDSVLQVLRLSISIFPLILLLLSVPLAYFYPITREKFDEMRAEIVAKAVTDFTEHPPATGPIGPTTRPVSAAVTRPVSPPPDDPTD
ncbi:MAG: MFS transporter [Chloroflexota bacterium]